MVININVRHKMTQVKKEYTQYPQTCNIKTDVIKKDIHKR